MTDYVEKIARLMHKKANQWHVKNSDDDDKTGVIVRWNELTNRTRQRYLYVAAAVAKEFWKSGKRKARSRR